MRNRRLMPSRRFLAADLGAHSRIAVGETDRYQRRFRCLVSMIVPRLPRIVTSRFRELLSPGLPPGISHAKDRDLKVEPNPDLKIAP